MMVWLAVRVVFLVILLRRLGTDTIDVCRGEIARSRLIVPAVMLGAAVLVANRLVPKPVAAAGLLAIDFLFLFFCLRLVRAIQRSGNPADMPEQRLERVLLEFFPPAFAKFVSVDVTVLSHVFAGLKAFVNVVYHTPHSYIGGSKIIMATVVMGAAIVPDAALFWFLLPRHLWWLAALLDILDVWAFLWLLGIYGTMAQRPHEVSPQRIVLRNGILQTVEFDPKDIKEQKLPIHSSWPRSTTG